MFGFKKKEKEVTCPHCGSYNITKQQEVTGAGKIKYICYNCGKEFER